MTKKEQRTVLAKLDRMIAEGETILSEPGSDVGECRKRLHAALDLLAGVRRRVRIYL